MSSLNDYKGKRNFKGTPEPDGTPQDSMKIVDHSSNISGRFVVQEHHARRLHWDFRLEKDGVLKSWAVPKGIPLNKGVKRLAVEVEDHPLEYIHFEGEIPQGNYGAGTVTIWDRGHYSIKEITNKKMEFVLLGEKLQGGYALINTKDNQWLMLKTYDEEEKAIEKR